MSIKILYNGYVCIREYDRGISDIVDDFMGEFDAYLPEPPREEK